MTKKSAGESAKDVLAAVSGVTSTVSGMVTGAARVLVNNMPGKLPRGRTGERRKREERWKRNHTKILELRWRVRDGFDTCRGTLHLLGSHFRAGSIREQLQVARSEATGFIQNASLACLNVRRLLRQSSNIGLLDLHHLDSSLHQPRLPTPLVGASSSQLMQARRSNKPKAPNSSITTAANAATGDGSPATLPRPPPARYPQDRNSGGGYDHNVLHQQEHHPNQGNNLDPTSPIAIATVRTGNDFKDDKQGEG